MSDGAGQDMQSAIYSLFYNYYYVFLVVIVAIALWELVHVIAKKKISWRYAIDSASSLLSLPLIAGLGYGMTLLGVGSVAAIGPILYEQYPIYQMPWSWGSLVLVLLLTDFWYYWSHRAFHRINIMWVTHTVHHSSDYINIPMAYRFGPLDGFFIAISHLPLAFFFDPLLVGVGIIANQVYQAWIHTDRIKKMPAWFEAVFNTPSHHRVHHGSNPKYIDKNYAGILICWDKMFGTFEAEDDAEPVRYGITKPLKYQDPITVLFHGFWRFGKKLLTVRSVKEFFFCIFMPPDWLTAVESNKKQLEENADAEEKGETGLTAGGGLDR